MAEQANFTSFHIPSKASRRKWKKCVNAERYDLGADQSGQPQYLIAMDVEGERRHYRSAQLPGRGRREVIFADLVRAYMAMRTQDEQSDYHESDETTDPEAAAEDILNELETENGLVQASAVCDAETLRLDGPQRDRLSTALWRYILANRDNQNPQILIAVGSAIRKFIALLSSDRMGEISELLATGHRAPLSLDLEIEIAKMVYRKFEANPPDNANPHSILADRLLDMAQTYALPRLVLHDKYATVATLSIDAVVAMRSEKAVDAIGVALGSTFKFFKEMVADDLCRLSARWRPKCSEAADWCDAIMRDLII